MIFTHEVLLFLHVLSMYAAPSSPPTEVNVLDVTSSNFTVQWAPPPAHTHNGIIRAYRINVTELNTARNFVRQTSRTSLVLSHLHPYYVYHLTVLAITVSDGPPTKGVTVTTLETSEYLLFIS